MSKLTKAQIFELVATEVANVTAQSTDLFKKNQADKYSEVLMARLALILAPKSGGGTSTKVNDLGEVYCNYFQTYYSANQFNTKLSKPNKETGERHEMYKANCIDAEQILRKIKSLKAMVTRQVTLNFMDKTINAEEMQVILTSLEAAEKAHYTNLADIPTVADIVGLTAPVAPADLDKEAQDDVDDMETWTEKQLSELDG